MNGWASLNGTIKSALIELVSDNRLKVRLKDGLLTKVGDGYSISCKGDDPGGFSTGVVEYLAHGFITAQCSFFDTTFIYTLSRAEFDAYIKNGLWDSSDKIEVNSQGTYSLIELHKGATFTLRLRPKSESKVALVADIIAVKED